ncbi:MAG: 3-phosphoshikimate 1-carboxyvinyltransferase [Ornithinimicrobium sp.]
MDRTDTAPADDAMPAGTLWPAPHTCAPVSGSVRVPGSKSLTNRYLALASLADGPSVLRHPLTSRDTTLMRSALTQLGTQIEIDEAAATWTVTPPSIIRPETRIDAGLAGTVMRFVPAIAALATGSTTFDGDEHARSRPIGPLINALRDLGVDIDDGGDPHLPFVVHGNAVMPGGEVGLDASQSSQFVSALLLVGARFEAGLTLRHTGQRMPSRPHIQMTVQTLEQAGVNARETEPGVWRVEPGPIRRFDVTVEPDLSSAAPFLALAAVTGGSITVAGWPTRTTQAGNMMPQVLTAMGATVDWVEGALTVTGPPRGTLRGLDLDLSDFGELTPVIAAVAALASTRSRLRGVEHLRGHETDRLAALHTELTRLGSDVTEHDDGMTIRPATLRGARLQTYGDHRMAMAAAVLGAAVEGISVVDVQTTSKTYPGFEDTWSALVS